MTKEKPSQRVWKFINTPLGSVVIGGLIVALLLGIVAWLWSWIIIQAGTLCALLISPVTIPVWLLVWLLAILIIPASLPIFFLIILVWALVTTKKETGARPVEPSWKIYTQGQFDEIFWTWEYDGNRPTNLSCFCPIDQTPLVAMFGPLPDRIYFKCDKCGKQFGPFDEDTCVADTKKRISRLIIGQNRSGEWKQAVESVKSNP